MDAVKSKLTELKDSIKQLDVEIAEKDKQIKKVAAEKLSVRYLIFLQLYFF